MVNIFFLFPSFQTDHKFTSPRNLAFSSFATLTRQPVAVIFQDPIIEEQTVPEIRGLLEELLAIVRAVGYGEHALPSSVINECIGATAELHRDPNMRHKASMLLDLECNRPIEVEVIVGELVRTAKKLGVSTPVSCSFFPSLADS